MNSSLKFFGGVETVTGSKHLLNINGANFLVDTGLFQGEKYIDKKNDEPIDLDILSIDAIFITHAHLDHCGYLPYLIRKGYRNKIYATAETLELMKVSLEDSAKLMKNKKESKHYYDQNDVHRALLQVEVVKWEKSLRIKGVEITYYRASHILGSSFVNFKIKGESVTFSGDLGRYHSIMQIAPQDLCDTDTLIIESTYGNRDHADANAEDKLADIITDAIKYKRTVLIPAFAIDRTQMILHLLTKLTAHSNLQIPIVLSGSMGIKVTEIYKRSSEFLKISEEEFENIFKRIRIIEHSNDLENFLVKSQGPQIIVAGSGMMSGGTILAHLEAFGQDANNVIVFTGFQANGTLGKQLLNGDMNVRIENQEIKVFEVQSKIESIEGLSAHGDRNDLLRWIKSGRKVPQRIFVIHGEDDAREAFKEFVEKNTESSAICPREGLLYDI
ncbi:MBL fold metallo-hydrolase [Bacteriovorax sp. Seq25_V]|uniref:MBL fold metallo-hydrolase n=1 Tax=Bacteriovorax sp. Seq25_V TaxID=1201288 RepID=UPI000389E115|nr:MBL fold metallo-hydrolase [Bacteriovorax sp. Seq25_V]EQC45345.1 beta-Casp domain protein [Bacteriovorax sp. Seq25_V]